MIEGGNATVYVTNMDASVDFYTKILGLRLRMRAADYWAEIEAGSDLVIGLHPATPNAPKPGSRGAIQIGLRVTEPLEQVVEKLTKRGATFDGDIVDDTQVKLAYLSDPDGNRLYLIEVKPAWQPAKG